MKKVVSNKNKVYIDLEENKQTATVSGANIIIIEREIKRLAKAIDETTKKLSFLL